MTNKKPETAYLDKEVREKLISIANKESKKQGKVITKSRMISLLIERAS
jgi:hypothetical protein